MIWWRSSCEGCGALDVVVHGVRISMYGCGVVFYSGEVVGGRKSGRAASSGVHDWSFVSGRRGCGVGLVWGIRADGERRLDFNILGEQRLITHEESLRTCT